MPQGSAGSAPGACRCEQSADIVLFPSWISLMNLGLSAAQQAPAALYRAKEGGRNRAVLALPSARQGPGAAGSKEALITAA
jgi:hypothetical protein